MGWRTLLFLDPVRSVRRHFPQRNRSVEKISGHSCLAHRYDWLGTSCHCSSASCGLLELVPGLRGNA